MSVINTRNAIFGWAVWALAKEAAKRKARQTVSSNGSRRGRKLVSLPLIAAVVGGAVVLWRRQQNGDDGS